MSGNAKKMIIAKNLMWLALFGVGSWYLFPKLFKSDAPNKLEMSRLKLGIDLQGGTYITLGVDINKAVENRLLSEGKYIENSFKNKNLGTLPVKQEIKDSNLVFTFPDESAAAAFYNYLKKEALSLKTSQSGNLVYSSLNPAEDAKIRNDSVDQAVHIIDNRLNSLGVEGIVVMRHGANQVVVQIPGVDDPQRVKDLITRRAHLEFKIVQQEASSKEEILDKFDGELPVDKTLVAEVSKETGEEGEVASRWYLVSAFPDLTGDHIIDARVKPGEYGEPEVAFKFDRSGGKIFKEVTGNNVGKRLAIIIDGVVQTAPGIQTAIGSDGRITGRYTYETANDLAIVLRTGSFQAPVTYQEERRIGPSLGQDSINKGLWSTLLGLFLVFLFSVFYYKVAGLLASLTLVVNLFLVLLFLSYFKATLTLPGIAGLALTIGMAIDVSVLIFEKIKEEMREGTSFRKAVSDGFSGTLAVILDSNITSFLTGLVLFYYGGPSIRGFAVVLMVGIVATLLAGIFFMRSVFELILDVFNFKKISV
ncbi:TPA: protein translocase subunit SecD [Candidatus Dependentiae bacterium]|nr:MAG: Protein translocase subunit SecD [candidate division TM6 bacterium GW2011_GWE2_31_21]KKP53772.1 MAG: Protein translocase subunit SecD [candidate division TM6 bacterium GW2011_GWF2_33_332]HBS48474.1 protein translocase subunit SecD [Candidatus Dependentiae bacterium]HBZ73089.1 protein translocase subunit SecD [Candidatus Dependentiae bacterium]